jgi:hypothetical protein
MFWLVSFNPDATVMECRKEESYPGDGPAAASAKLGTATTGSVVA